RLRQGRGAWPDDGRGRVARRRHRPVGRLRLLDHRHLRDPRRHHRAASPLSGRAAPGMEATGHAGPARGYRAGAAVSIQFGSGATTLRSRPSMAITGAPSIMTIPPATMVLTRPRPSTVRPPMVAPRAMATWISDTSRAAPVSSAFDAA